MKFSRKLGSTDLNFLRLKKAAELRTPAAYIILETKAFLPLSVYHAQNWYVLHLLESWN